MPAKSVVENRKWGLSRAFYRQMVNTGKKKIGAGSLITRIGFSHKAAAGG